MSATKKVTSNAIYFAEFSGRKAVVLHALCILKEYIVQQKKVFFPVKLRANEHSAVPACDLLLIHPPSVFCHKYLNNFSFSLALEQVHPSHAGYFINCSGTLIITTCSFIIQDFKTFLCFVFQVLQPTLRRVCPWCCGNGSKPFDFGIVGASGEGVECEFRAK